MKRYLLFRGDHYYPLGGWDDYEADFDSLAAAESWAESWARNRQFSWWQIVDTATCEVVSRDEA